MIKYKIKKVLFAEVMGITFSASDKIMENNRYIKYGKNKHISLADFFFKCHKWAFTLTPKYILGSSYRSCALYKHNMDTNFELLETFDNINQKQALFDACHHILELRKINDTTKN